MSNAYKCDRCGALYDERSVFDFSLLNSDETNIDLCPKCQSELETWLRNRGKDEPNDKSGEF